MTDIHTSLQNGFCYGRFNPGQQNLFSNLPYLEIGKFSGEFPFVVEISGEYAGNIFSDKVSISKEYTVPSDSLISQFWIGNEILEIGKIGRLLFINQRYYRQIDQQQNSQPVHCIFMSRTGNDGAGK